MRKIILYITLLFLLWPIANNYGQKAFLNRQFTPSFDRGTHVTKLFRHGNDILVIGTDRGLYSYDGLHSEQYLREDGGSQHITAIGNRGHQYLIAYEDGSICLWAKDRLQVLIASDTTPLNRITALVSDKDGNTWLGTYGTGLWCLSADGKLSKIDLDDLEDIYDLAITNDEYLHAGTDQGLISWKTNESPPSFQKNQIRYLPSEIVTKITAASTGNRLIIQTFDSDVFIGDKTENKPWGFTPVEMNGSSVLFPIFSDRFLVINSNGYIINQLDNQQMYSDTFSNLLLKRPFSPSLGYLDQKNTLWIWCQNNGLINVPLDIARLFSESYDIQALEMIGADLYIGTSKKLLKYHPSGSYRVLLDGINITRIAQEKGYTWVGTLNNGLYCLKNDRVVKIINEEKGLASNTILSFEPYENSLLVGTLAGVQKVNIFDWKVDPVPYLDNVFYPYDMVSQNNQIWVCGDGKGIKRFKNEKLIHQYLEGKTIYQLSEYQDKVVWALSDENKIYRYLEHSDEFKEEISLTISSKIFSIISPDPSRLFINTEDALYFAIADSTGTFRVENITSHSTISSGFLNTLAIDDNAHLWYAIDGEVFRFKFDSFSFSKPYVGFHGCNLGTYDLLSTSQDIFPHTASVFSFDFYGIWYRDPDVLKYRYQLIGYDKEWKISRDVKQVYSKIPPGEYQFNLEVTNDGGITWNRTYSRDFKIKKAFWHTWGFRVVTIALIILFIFFILQQLNHQKEQKQKLANERLMNELNIIKSQINPHFLFNSFNTLLNLIEEDQEKAARFTNHLSDYFRNMVKYKDAQLISIDEELKILHAYIQILKERFGESLDLKIDAQIDQIKSGLIVPQTLATLIENVVKHNIITADRPIIVHLKKEGDGIVVCNPIHLKKVKEESTHFGLAALAKRYQSYGFSIKIDETDGNYCVHIPIIHESEEQ